MPRKPRSRDADIAQTDPARDRTVRRRNPASKARRDIVALGASGGGLEALTLILAKLPPEFPAAVVIVMHRGNAGPNLLPDILGRHSNLPTQEATEGMRIIHSLSAAVVVLSAERRITMWNLAAERLLGLPEREAAGKLIWSLRIPAVKRRHLLRIRKSLAQSLDTRLENLA